MLILSRRKHETIYIGDDIRISVIEMIGNQIRLGFEADQKIPIYREEIYQQRKQDSEQHSE